MNTMEYLQFLLERAITNKTFGDTDGTRIYVFCSKNHIADVCIFYIADRLCKCAITMKWDWITVHSMWVNLCNQLLQKYAIQKYKNNLKMHKRSKRRGSSGFVPPMYDFEEVKDENEIKPVTKICAAISYPLGQSSTASKTAAAKEAIDSGAKRIR